MREITESEYRQGAVSKIIDNISDMMDKGETARTATNIARQMHEMTTGGDDFDELLYGNGKK
jgi:hypothetical protein